MSIGERIKKERKAAKLTQTQLAEKIHKTLSSIQKYEMGITQPPLDVIMDIAHALDVPIIDFLAIDPNDPEDQKTFKRYIKNGRVEMPGLMDGKYLDDELPATTPATDEQLKFALFGTDGEITDEMMEDVKRYAQFIKERKKATEGDEE